MNKELAKTIGAAAREKRKALQLTQEDIAERIGVSVEFYARIERGTSLPSITTFARVVLALGADANELLGWCALPGAVLMPEPPKDGSRVRVLIRAARSATPEAITLATHVLSFARKTECREYKLCPDCGTYAKAIGAPFTQGSIRE